MFIIPALESLGHIVRLVKFMFQKSPNKTKYYIESQCVPEASVILFLYTFQLRKWKQVGEMS